MLLTVLKFCGFFIPRDFNHSYQGMDIPVLRSSLFYFGNMYLKLFSYFHILKFITSFLF